MPRKIILDVDTGSDDACAIMLAYLRKEIDLVAVCTVKGNQKIEYTTENTLRIRELLSADFPVYKGCSGSMIKNVVYPRIPPTANADAYLRDLTLRSGTTGAVFYLEPGKVYYYEETKTAAHYAFDAEASGADEDGYGANLAQRAAHVAEEDVAQRRHVGG